MANMKEVVARAESLCARLDLHCTQREHRADAINPQQVRENNQLRPFDGGTAAARGDADKDWSAKLRELETAYEYWEEKGNSAKMKEFAEKIKEHKRKRADDAARGDAKGSWTVVWTYRSGDAGNKSMKKEFASRAEAERFFDTTNSSDKNSNIALLDPDMRTIYRS